MFPGMQSTGRPTRTPRRQSDAHRVVVARAEQYVHANLHARCRSRACAASSASANARSETRFTTCTVFPQTVDARYPSRGRAPRPHQRPRTRYHGHRHCHAHGFYELGRFAATYTRKFSVNLRPRRCAESRSEATASGDKGPDDVRTHTSTESLGTSRSQGRVGTVAPPAVARCGGSRTQPW